MKLKQNTNTNKDGEDIVDPAVISPPVDPCCTSCFGPNKCKKGWNDTDSAQMSDIYCRSPKKTSTNQPAENTALLAVEESQTDDDTAINLCETPACLEKFPTKKTKSKLKNILNVESELIVGKNMKKTFKSANISTVRSTTTSTLTTNISNIKKDKKLVASNPKKDIKDKLDKSRLSSLKSKKKLSLSPVRMVNGGSNSTKNKLNICNSKVASKKVTTSSAVTAPIKTAASEEKLEEYEIADDVTSLNDEEV